VARKKKGGKKKALRIVAIVVIVLVIAGIAGWKWHEQPSFCGSVCHKVMASYYDGWNSGDTLANAHKVADDTTSTLLPDVSYDTVECLDCHVQQSASSLKNSRCTSPAIIQFRWSSARSVLPSSASSAMIMTR